MAFALGKFAIEEMKSKGISMSFDKLREELSEIESSIFMDILGKENKFYISPSPLNENQQAIYSAFGIRRRITPWAP
jgi:vancomycin permeability regulator SanA